MPVAGIAFAGDRGISKVGVTPMVVHSQNMLGFCGLWNSPQLHLKAVTEMSLYSIQVSRGVCRDMLSRHKTIHVSCKLYFIFGRFVVIVYLFSNCIIRGKFLFLIITKMQYYSIVLQCNLYQKRWQKILSFHVFLHYTSTK